MFNNLFIAYLSFVWIEAKLSAGAALAQKIPTLIQFNLDLPHTSVFDFIEIATARQLHKLVFLVYEFGNGV